MTTAEKTRSAYPAPVADLLPDAQALADRLGRMPSRNQIMSELKVGAPKAREVLAVLIESGFDPAAQAGTRRLNLVPDPASQVGLDPVSNPVPADLDPASQVGSDPVSNPVPADLDPASQASLDSVSNPVSVDPAPVSQVGSDPVSDRGREAHPDPVRVDPNPAADPVAAPAAQAGPTQVNTPADPGTKPVRTWPVLLLAAPAFVAIWSGWVGLGGLTGFGVVHPLPGIWDSLELNTAITLPIGVETYAAFALRVWLSGRVQGRAREFAKRSAIGSLVLGALGQVAYHLMVAAGMTQAPWQITTLVACLPVAVLGMGAALAHLIHEK